MPLPTHLKKLANALNKGYTWNAKENKFGKKITKSMLKKSKLITFKKLKL